MMIGMVALMMLAQAAPAGPAPRPCPVAAEIPRTPDGTVLGTIGAIDANELEAAKLAATKASSSTVRALAAALVKDHERSLATGGRLAKQFTIVRLLPADSMMARDHKAAMLQLNTTSGSEFDKVFITATLADHKRMITQITATLLPAAQRPEVKAFVRGLLPQMKAHQLREEQWLAAHP